MTDYQDQGEFPASIMGDPKPALTLTQGLAVFGGVALAIITVVVLWVVTDLYVI